MILRVSIVIPLGDLKKALIFEITREIIEVKSVKSKIIDDSKMSVKFKLKPGMYLLKSKKIVKKNVTKFKILGMGEINDKINLDTKLLSKSAKDKLSKSGSTFISKSNS